MIQKLETANDGDAAWIDPEEIAVIAEGARNVGPDGDQSYKLVTLKAGATVPVLNTPANTEVLLKPARSTDMIGFTNEMRTHKDIVFLTEDDSFDESCFGKRLFCVLVPVSRKLEFLASRLRQSLQMCTDKIIFYTE